MEQTNGTTQKKNILFSIGSYNSKEAPVINKISTNGLFSSDCPPPMPGTWSNKRRPVSLDFTDDASFRRNGYSTLPTRATRHFNGVVEKPTCPPASTSCARFDRIPENNGIVDKPAHPPINYKRSASLEPEQLHHSGRVALTIASYEGEARTPTRLDFLPQTRISRSNSKASSIASTPVVEDVELNSRLQNELVATLMRSNLKKKNDEEATSPVLQENGKVNTDESDKPSKESTEKLKETKLDDFKDGSDKDNKTQLQKNQNGKDSNEKVQVSEDINGKNLDEKVHVQEVQNVNNSGEKVQAEKDYDKKNSAETVQDEFKFTNGNVKKLADVLGQKMTFKLNPEIS